MWECFWSTWGPEIDRAVPGGRARATSEWPPHGPPNPSRAHARASRPPSPCVALLLHTCKFGSVLPFCQAVTVTKDEDKGDQYMPTWGDAHGGSCAHLRGSPAKSCEVLLPWRAQKLTNNCSESRDVGQMLGPKLTNTLRSSHKVGRPWPQLIKSWPSPARVGRTWPVFGPNRPNLDQVRHQCWLAKFEQILAQTGQLWSLAKSR